MTLITEVTSILGPSVGWLVAFLWLLEQLYNPLWETKLQTFHGDLTHRLERIEVIQISMAQEVEGMSDEQISKLHDHDELDPSDLKANGSDRSLEDL